MSAMHVLSANTDRAGLLSLCFQQKTACLHPIGRVPSYSSYLLLRLFAFEIKEVLGGPLETGTETRQGSYNGNPFQIQPLYFT